jgi:hypothetical protein
LDTAGKALCRLDGERLCAAARRRTKLEDFGEPAVDPALAVLIDSLEEDAGLHPLGRFLIRVHLQSILETRLRLAEYWKDKQERLRKVSLRRPVFIVGMPRSGSTFLHELLAEDPENRAPQVWEVMFPVPDDELGGRDKRKRIRKADTCLWWFRRLAPQADSVYPMRATTPHECVAIHSYTLLSQEFISTCRVQSYEEFLARTDLRPAYAWQRRFLQHLQLGAPAKRWVLKSPDHVYGLEELFSIFPDAHVIQTHRNPLEVVRSSTELTRVLQGLFGWKGERSEVAAREARILAAGTERSMRFRDQHPELAHRFIDVKYSDLTSDALTTVKEVYQRLDCSLSATAENRIRELSAKRSRYAGGRGGFRPAAFARESGVELIFRQYCSRFDLSWGDSS